MIHTALFRHRSSHFAFYRPRFCSRLKPLNTQTSRNMASNSSQKVFQLKVDPLSGNSEWVVIEDRDDDEELVGSLQEPLLATTSYLDMLNDSCRNSAYRAAIDKTVTKPCHVLDIGAGTGLLSMMAARAMSSHEREGCSSTKGMVTACESYLPMVKLMRKVLHINGMGKNINVINKRSDELKVGVDIASRADILVSEILDSELLGEGLIPTLQHAHDMLLVENPISVPYKATIYSQLVESTFLWKLNDLYNNEANLADSIRLISTGLSTVLSVKAQQYAMHCNALTEEIKLLSEPFKIFEFDFSKRPESRGKTELQIKATSDGRIHALVSWWVLQLDREGTIFYSTAPKWIHLPTNESTRAWCDHWKQCVWFIPGEGMPIAKDDKVQLQAAHTETSVSYDLKGYAPKTVVSPNNSSVGGFQLMLSPERIGLYGDSNWRVSMLTAVKKALQLRDPSLCVVADDSVLLTTLLAKLSEKLCIISLFPGLRENGAQYLQAVAGVNGFSTDRIEVPAKKKTYLNTHDTQQRKVDLLIGEPFYYGNEGMLPWQNLRFWKERTMLDSVLAEDALIMPCKGILRACAMSLPDLWNSRRCLGRIEGFDHSVVNTTLGACGELPAPREGPCLPFFIWQCGEIKELSEAFTVMEFDFSKPISSCYGKAEVEFIKRGVCHGFVLWIDWVMDAENSIVVSTGPDQRFWKQGVKLLAKPVEVGNHEYSYATVEASFAPTSGEVDVKHAFF